MLKKNLFKKAMLGLVGAMALSLTAPAAIGTSHTVTKVEAATKLPALSAKKLNLTPGKSETLKVNNLSKGMKLLTWTSSNKAVATVDRNGKVTAKKVGKATITAKVNASGGMWNYTCEVTVTAKAGKTTYTYTTDLGKKIKVDDITYARLTRDYKSLPAKDMISYYVRGYASIVKNEKTAQKVMDAVDEMLDLLYEHSEELNIQGPYTLAAALTHDTYGGNVNSAEVHYKDGMEKGFNLWYSTSLEKSLKSIFMEYGSECMSEAGSMTLVINRAAERAGYTQDELYAWGVRQIKHEYDDMKEDRPHTYTVIKIKSNNEHYYFEQNKLYKAGFEIPEGKRIEYLRTLRYGTITQQEDGSYEVRYLPESEYIKVNLEGHSESEYGITHFTNVSAYPDYDKEINWRNPEIAKVTVIDDIEYLGK